MGDTGSPRVVRIMRWCGRCLAVLLLSLWGAFFVEHVADWFAGKHRELPPLSVWLGTGLHLLILVGLALMWWKELWGSILTILATAAFVIQIGPCVFPWIAFVNLAPLPFFAAAWLFSRGNAATGAAS